MTTNQFNFLGLPSVVQELITNEIVHNLCPEDWIQFSLTSKYCKELVQRARPKKIIDQFSIRYSPVFYFYANQKGYHKSVEELMEILSNCQIKELQLEDESVFLHANRQEYSKILHVIFEAAKFATNLNIFFGNPLDGDDLDEFYVKLKHLKKLFMWDNALILSFYPSKIKIKYELLFESRRFMEDLVKKTANCPLSSLNVCADVPVDIFWEFLKNAKFTTGAEIYFSSIVDDDSGKVFMTFLGNDLFTIEAFQNETMVINVKQKLIGKNKRILKLVRLYDEFFPPYIPANGLSFHVLSETKPKQPIFFGILKKDEEEFVIENVDENEWIKIHFEAMEFPLWLHYSAKMLDSFFPRDDSTITELERVNKINKMIGTKMKLIQPTKEFQNLQNLWE